MIKISKFIFNSFMVNTYLLADETGECVVIDPACHDDSEKAALSDFIAKNNLRVARCLNTHCHVDHVLGNDFIFTTYGIKPEYHEDSVPYLLTLKEIGASFGYTIGNIPEPERFLLDNETVQWGNSSLEVLFTPGHAAGSVCFYNSDAGFVITGDVLFADTIGRTDLPGGDFDQLMASIRQRLFTLPEGTTAYPGHGPETTIGYEMRNNPFIR